jgi:hypothetical protein
MRSDGIRIIKATQPLSGFSGGFDHTHSYMQGYVLDLSRKTAALMRQSRRGADEANPESRLRQEGLGRIAVEIRGDHDPLMVLPCDEGSGVSGQKKIYERPKLLELWKAIQDGTVGSIIVAREDRLFRDRWLTQVSQFAEACARRGVLLIVAGRRCYDFRILDDFNAFIRKMQEAYGYIDTHIRYMNDMQRQKKERGEWAGGLLIAPYAIDRGILQAARERRKIIKEFGSSEEDELFISKASRPVIYEGWHQIAIDLFEKFRMFNFSRSRFGRYIEDLPYIFPMPTPADLRQYLFSVRMRLVPGRGYTFSASHRMTDWLSNLMHIGYASAGKDSDGNRIYLEGAFDAAIPRELFEECYGAITGFTLDGNPSGTGDDHSHFVRKSYAEHRYDLLTQCFTSLDVPMTVQVRWDVRTVLCYFGCLKRTGEGVKRLSPYETTLLWTLPTQVFDHAIVDRLTALATHDKKLADRVEKYYTELTKNTAAEKKSIEQDIANLEALIAHFDRLITNPAQPLSETQEKRYLGQQADAEVALAKARAALLLHNRNKPSEFIPAYYRILGKAPGEFWNLDVDRQRRMLRMLIDEIQITNLSPHMYKLHLKWKEPVASRWDAALIYKRQAVRTNKLGEQEWTSEEDQLIRELWPVADKMEICKMIPTKAGATIGARAFILGVERDDSWRGKRSLMHRSLCYDDWAKSCAALNIDITTDEGMQLLETLNYYAKTTGTKQRAAIWWVLPVVQMNYIDDDLSSQRAAQP